MSPSLVSTAILAISLTAVVLLSALNSNAFAVTVNHTDFSLQVPDGWAYRENYLYRDNIVLTPREFADTLLFENASSSMPDIQQGEIKSFFERDTSYNIKNAPLETYVKYFLSYSNGTAPPRYENSTVDGERAIKAFVNHTSSGTNYVTYFVIHNDQPYNLAYMSTANNYQKYLPQFEQMVKTFKFAK